MDNPSPKLIQLDDIPDKAFLRFQMSITPQKIYDFFEQSMSHHEKAKSKDSHKLIKSDFLSICNSIFSKDLNNNIYINSIYELIFDRLKERKCVFKLNENFSSRHYALSDIISTEKIEILFAQLFFSVLMLTNFRAKLETMFHVVDTDNDGLINEAEIKKLVITANRLFYEESKEKFSKSSLIQQSLSNFKANKALSKLLYGSADLKNILEKSKYISFSEFYERLKKVDNYMYEIIPTFINLRSYLGNKKEEIEFYMNDNCKKDFVDISYELINKNKMLNLTNQSQRNTMKQFFDKRKIIKHIKIDPLKEIKERKQREKEMKLKKLIESKKKEFGKKYNQFLHLSLPKSNLSESNIKFKQRTSIKVADEKEFNYNTPTDKMKSSNQIINEEEKYKSTKSLQTNKTNNTLKKVYTAEYKEKLCLYSDKEGEKSTGKKYPNSFPLLKETRKKTILNKIFQIPMEVSPFDIIDKNTKDKNKINNDKIVNNSENVNQNIIDTKLNTTSGHNFDTNFTTLGITSPAFSEKNDKYLNFKKISIFNKKKQDKNKEKWEINRTYLKQENKLIEPISPRCSIINNTTSRKYFPNFYINNDKNSKERNIELGDYSKFSQILFPPCIIRTKEKGSSNSFYYTKNSFMKKTKTKRMRKIKKFKGVDFSKTLLNTYEEIKDEILDELEQQRNSDINGISAILRIKKSIEEKTKKFQFVDFDRNKVTFKNFFIIDADNKKKSD